MRLPLISLLAAVAAAAAVAPSASAAAQRYASPTGSGSSCTSTSPCSIATAIGGGTPGDEVILAPGDYHPTTPLTTPTQMTVHGVAGKPRPRLLLNGMQLSVMSGSTLRYVEVDQAPGSDAFALVAHSTTLVDQVIARASGGGSTARIEGGTIRDSIVVATGTTGTAITTDAGSGLVTGLYRNVTAVASGANGVAIRAQAGSLTGNAIVTLVNVIASGQDGLEARTDSSGAQASIILSHTNYIQPAKVGTHANIVDLGGNQTAAPTFADWQAGDYREAPGSVTIGAGRTDPDNGTLDVDGDPRNVEAVDIGADEFVPAPAAVTGGAAAVTDRSATLSGTVDAHGAPTTYRFEYGPTTAYGGSTASSNAGTGAAAAAGSVSGLAPATTYHYRLVAANSGGVAHGADRTFTTAAAVPPAPTPVPPSTPTGTTAPPAPSPFAGVALVSHKLAYAHRIVTVRLRCPAGAVGRCSGRTKLTAHRHTLGRANFSIAAGGEARVRVRVRRGLLGHASRLRAKAVNAAHDGAGRSKTRAAAVTIRRHHR